MISMSVKQLKFSFLTLLLFFGCSFSFAQNELSTLDSMIQKIELVLPSNWNVEKFSDSILILNRDGYVHYGGRQIRGTTDSIRYKFFIILEERVKDEATCIKEFVDLTLKIQAEADTTTKPYRIKGKFTFELYHKHLFQKYLPYQIPPNLFFPNYTLTIFDNMPSNYSIIKQEEMYEEIYNVLQKVISSIYTNKKPQIYIDYLIFDHRMYIANTVGWIHWGALRFINYPQLKGK